MLPVWVCAAGVAGCLVAERTGRLGWLWLAKPLASAAFLWAAWAAGAAESALGLAFFSGLALCALGDVLLIPRGSVVWLRAGMAAFGLGHLRFALAFLGHGVAGAWLVAGAGLMVGFGAAVWAWLGGRLEPGDRLPVAIYTVVIAAMVATGIGAAGAGAPLALPLGAGLFALSDLAVAQDRFVRPSFTSSLWGLPTYYAAQLAIAFGAGALVA